MFVLLLRFVVRVMRSCRSLITCRASPAFLLKIEETGAISQKSPLTELLREFVFYEHSLR